MSSGHHHQQAPAVSRASIDALLANPAIRERLWAPHEENNDFDIPYIAGYAKDDKKTYYDRHLPEVISLHLDGHNREISPREFLRRHETLEKAIIDALGWGYFPAHAAATAYEKRGVLERLGPQWWMPYTHAMDGYARVDEHEQITTVPKDLDMTPYRAAPVNTRLLTAMQKAQGAPERRSKETVHYTTEGRPSEHCGPVPAWPRGDCEHFQSPFGCAKVRGYISAKGWCELWQGQKAQ